MIETLLVEKVEDYEKKEIIEDGEELMRFLRQATPTKTGAAIEYIVVTTKANDKKCHGDPVKHCE